MLGWQRVGLPGTSPTRVFPSLRLHCPRGPRCPPCPALLQERSPTPLAAGFTNCSCSSHSGALSGFPLGWAPPGPDLASGGAVRGQPADETHRRPRSAAVPRAVRCLVPLCLASACLGLRSTPGPAWRLDSSVLGSLRRCSGGACEVGARLGGCPPACQACVSVPPARRPCLPVPWVSHLHVAPGSLLGSVSTAECFQVGWAPGGLLKAKGPL